LTYGNRSEINSITKYNAVPVVEVLFGGQVKCALLTDRCLIMVLDLDLTSSREETGSTAISLDIEQLQVSVAPYDVRQSGFDRNWY
jgi:hypothetical protein